MMSPPSHPSRLVGGSGMGDIILCKVAPILGSAYRISAYRPTSACIGIGCFVTDMADNQLRMRKTDHCHMLIILSSLSFVVSFDF